MITIETVNEQIHQKNWARVSAYNLDSANSPVSSLAVHLLTGGKPPLFRFV